MSKDFRYTDLSYLEEISGGDQSFINEIIELFVKQMPESIEHMREALNNNDPVTIGEAAHKAKPSAIYIGNKTLEQDLRTLQELKSTNAIGDDTASLIDRVAAESERAIAELQARK
jgi:HPt (histidine-containing phosphotransfer) domain-containing protein